MHKGLENSQHVKMRVRRSPVIAGPQFLVGFVGNIFQILWREVIDNKLPQPSLSDTDEPAKALRASPSFVCFSVLRDSPSFCDGRNYIGSTERGNLYLQSPFPGVLNNIFKLPGDSILNSIRAALTTYRRRHLSHYNETEIQIGGEGCSPRLFATRTNRA
jgi:hypothetical protein